MLGVLKKRGGLTDLVFFGGGGARQNEVRSIFQCEVDNLEDTMMDFQKKIHENVEKNN